MFVGVKSPVVGVVMGVVEVWHNKKSGGVSEDGCGVGLFFKFILIGSCMEPNTHTHTNNNMQMRDCFIFFFFLVG